MAWTRKNFAYLTVRFKGGDGCVRLPPFYHLNHSY